MMRGDNSRGIRLSELYVHKLPNTNTTGPNSRTMILGIALQRTKTLSVSHKNVEYIYSSSKVYVKLVQIAIYQTNII